MYRYFYLACHVRPIIRRYAWKISADIRLCLISHVFLFHREAYISILGCLDGCPFSRVSETIDDCHVFGFQLPKACVYASRVSMSPRLCTVAYIILRCHVPWLLTPKCMCLCLWTCIACFRDYAFWPVVQSELTHRSRSLLIYASTSKRLTSSTSWANQRHNARRLIFMSSRRARRRGIRSSVQSSVMMVELTTQASISIEKPYSTPNLFPTCQHPTKKPTYHHEAHTKATELPDLHFRLP
jgi:hypothetical protein